MEKIVSTTKIRKVGNALGVIIPKKALDILNIKEGDFIVIKSDSLGRIIYEKQI